MPLSTLEIGDHMEHRKFPRFSVELHGLFSGHDAEGEGTVFNLSFGGCAIRSNIQVQKGDYLRLQVYLPTRMTRFVVDLAPVRWTNRQEFGLEFITMTPRDQKWLQDYIAALQTACVPTR